jgi:hypothetical protein
MAILSPIALFGILAVIGVCFLVWFQDTVKPFCRIFLLTLCKRRPLQAFSKGLDRQSAGPIFLIVSVPYPWCSTRWPEKGPGFKDPHGLDFVEKDQGLICHRAYTLGRRI